MPGQKWGKERKMTKKKWRKIGKEKGKIGKAMGGGKEDRKRNIGPLNNNKTDENETENRKEESAGSACANHIVANVFTLFIGVSCAL